MRILSEKEIEDLDKIVKKANLEGMKTWKPFYEKVGNIEALIEFPLGEIMNPNIRGFVWAWAANKVLNPINIENDDRFNAQGLEGKISIPSTLISALLVYKELPPYRRQIRVKEKLPEDIFHQHLE